MKNNVKLLHALYNLATGCSSPQTSNPLPRTIPPGHFSLGHFLPGQFPPAKFNSIILF